MNTKPPKSIYIIRPGGGGLPRLELAAQDGARAEVYLQGAQVTSWVPAGGHERLFLSQRSEFRSGVPIRGGIPVVFPQFGATGPLPLHGFARLTNWEFAGAQELGDRACAVFQLRDHEKSRNLWPHAFLAELTVSVGGNRIEVTLGITNTGSEPFSFTTALHTYLQVFYLSEARVNSLHSQRYRDAADGGIEKLDQSPYIDFTGEVNRIYLEAPAEACLVEPGLRTMVRKAGFMDTVVWNPGKAKCAAMPDLEPGAYRNFVCVEAATAGAPVQLAARERWTGTQILEV